MRNSDRNAAAPTDSDVTTGRDPTTSADPTTADTARGNRGTGDGDAAGEKGASGSGLHEPKQPTMKEAQNESDGHGGPPTNIPMAGGERIGTKHWGESKVIPDVPPRRASADKGVSSAAGQPDGKRTSKHISTLIRSC